MFRRILICDEKRFSASMLKQMIYKNGEYIVSEADTLVKAKMKIDEKRAEEEEYDFIVVSLEFDKEELFAFLEQIQKEGFEGEIALAGAVGLEDETINRALSLKVRKFLTKPFKESEIVNFL